MSSSLHSYQCDLRHSTLPLLQILLTRYFTTYQTEFMDFFQISHFVCFLFVSLQFGCTLMFQVCLIVFRRFIFVSFMFSTIQ